MCKRNTEYPLYSISKVSDFHDLIRQKAENHPDNIAFGWYEKDRKVVVTYKQFYNESLALAKLFLEKGHQKHHIGIFGKNTYGLR